MTRFTFRSFLKGFIFLSIIFFSYQKSNAQHLGNALNFDGVDDNVNCGNNASLDVTDGFTLEAWVYPTSFKPNVWEGTIIEKCSGNYDGYMLRAGNSGQVDFYFGDGAIWNGVATSTGALSLDTWHHVAGVYDGSALTIYVDGVSIASASASGTVALTSAPLLLGSASGFSGRQFPGSIDEVRVWNVARSQSEIQADMNSYITSAHSQWSNLKAYYRFDQGTSSGNNSSLVNEVIDYSGNCNKGTLSGLALFGTSSNWVFGGNAEAPILTTLTATNVNSGTATLRGEILSVGEFNASSFGVEASTSSCFSSPLIFSQTEEYAEGIFNMNATGLSGSTTYYYRAFAINSKGKSYGETRSFTTLACTPPNSELTVFAVTSNICEGQNASVHLSASQTGVSYTLMNGTNPVGDYQNGTGGLLVFSADYLTSTTTFSIKASKSGCADVTLTQTQLITVFSAPDRNLTVGAESNSICIGTGTNITVENTEIGVSYTLMDFAVVNAIGASQNGTGGTLSFSTGNLSANTTFRIKAVKTDCSDAILYSSITVNVVAVPGAPTGSSSQVFYGNKTVSNLIATGTGIKWYDAATNGNLLDATDALVYATHYYASQTVSGCESSDRLEVVVTANTEFSGVNNGDNICSSTGVIALNASNDLTGTFSGPGVTDYNDGTGSFDPTAAGAGNHNISYTVELPGEFTKVVSGDYHTLGIKADGTLWTWGSNFTCALGNGCAGFNSQVPVKIGTDTWIAVAGGYSQSLGIKSDGTLWAWGSNGYGEFGDGTDVGSLVPKKVGTSQWKSIAASYIRSVGVKADGTLWAWGNNDGGLHGDGTTNSSLNQIQIGTDNNWKSVVAGRFTTFAIKTDGTLWAWGQNTYGQLGDGTTNNGLTPKQVGTDNTWTSVAVGNTHTLGIKSDGTLWAWGHNSVGQLGDGTTTDSQNPLLISGSWKAVAAGIYFSLGIKADGTLWSWGDITNGKLGDPTSDGTIPRQVGTDAWTSVDAELNSSFGIKSNGTLWAWGNDEAGRLGNGADTDQNAPAATTPGTMSFTGTKNVTVTLTPTADDPADVRACTSYELPALSAGNNYFTGAGGTGTALSAGNSITSTQTIYVRKVNGVCSNENSMVVNVFDCIPLDVASCNTTQTNLSDAVYAETVVGATDYRFKIEYAATSYVAGTSTGSSSNFIRLSWLTANPVKYGTTYTISASAKVGGLWMPFGNTCTVTTPATRIQNSYANTTLNSLTDALYSYEVAGATNYRYEIRKASDNSLVTTSVRGTNDNLFRLSWVSGGLIQNNTGYKIRVSAYVGGSWQACGPAVTINSPIATQLATGSCGVNIPTLSTALYSDNVASATNYRYEIRKASDNSLITVSTRGTNDNLFRLSWVTGIQLNTTYSIKVAAYVGSSWSSYGTACTVTTPSAMVLDENNHDAHMSGRDAHMSGRDASRPDSAREMHIFPNPNNGNFTIRTDASGAYQLLNELGQVIRVIEVPESGTTDVEGLGAGVYFLKGQQITEKIIVQ